MRETTLGNPGDEEETRRQYYRTEMAKLAGINGAQKTALALKAVHDAFSGLKPMQPINIKNLKERLEKLGFKLDNVHGLTAETVSVLIGAYETDRTKWELVLSEYGLLRRS